MNAARGRSLLGVVGFEAARAAAVLACVHSTPEPWTDWVFLVSEIDSDRRVRAIQRAAFEADMQRALRDERPPPEDFLHRMADAIAKDRDAIFIVISTSLEDVEMFRAWVVDAYFVVAEARRE